MARFKCINSDCEMADKDVIVSKIRWVFNSSLKKLVSKEPILCKVCGEELNFIKNEAIPVVHFNSFDSLDPAQKRDVIHKRSMDHFKKTDKGELARHKQRIIDDNKRAIIQGGK